VPVREILEELEPLATGCEMVDVDKLLRECGYEVSVHGVIVRYTNDAWESILTYPAGKKYFPGEELQDLVAFIRRKLG
jgi:hypothetical protein